MLDMGFLPDIKRIMKLLAAKDDRTCSFPRLIPTILSVLPTVCSITRRS